MASGSCPRVCGVLARRSTHRHALVEQAMKWFARMFAAGLARKLGFIAAAALVALVAKLGGAL